MIADPKREVQRTASGVQSGTANRHSPPHPITALNRGASEVGIRCPKATVVDRDRPVSDDGAAERDDPIPRCPHRRSDGGGEVDAPVSAVAPDRCESADDGTVDRLREPGTRCRNDRKCHEHDDNEWDHNAPSPSPR